MMGIGTVDLMDVDTGEDLRIRPLAPVINQDTNAAGSGGGTSGADPVSGEETNTEPSSGFWSKVKSFFLRLFGRSPEESTGSEDPAIAMPGTPRQCIMEYQILLNSQAALEICALNAFDMVILRTSNENIGITCRPAV